MLRSPGSRFPQRVRFGPEQGFLVTGEALPLFSLADPRLGGRTWHLSCCIWTLGDEGSCSFPGWTDATCTQWSC